MMPEQERKPSAQHDQSIDATQVPKAESAVEKQPAVTAVPPSASFGELTGEAATEAKKPETPPPLVTTDAVIEQLAHGMVAKDLDGKDDAFLKANGFDALPIIRGQHEFVMRTFVPTQAGKAPIVAFRGTVPSKAQTLIADLDPSGIGMYQFNPNRQLIQDQMNAAAGHGKIISAGHSLGGALAQIAAATFPDLVGRVVTFQAPGVSKETAKKLEDYNKDNPDEAIESSHHRVKGDLVPLGGEALTPGVIHNHEMKGGNIFQRNPLAKHTSMPLAQEEIAAGNDVPIHGDREMVYTGDTTTEKENADKTQVVEHARAGLGKLVFGVGKLFN